MELITFEDLGLDETSLASIAAKGFTQPTPIQILAIPRLLSGDANLVAKARTGTGKTAAFALPLIQTIRSASPVPRALILTPTRELALQVSKETASLASGAYPRITAVYGGQSMSEQLRALKRGVEIVVGTPGRIMDHLKRGSLKLDAIDYFILDEADEMLDMGFIEDIEEIFSQANSESRVLLFSATMPQPILKIAAKFMGDYEIIEEEASPEEPVLTEQTYWVVRESEKINALVRLIDISGDFYGLVFTQTKVDADHVARQLDERGYEAAALHGDIAQNQREIILERFRKKKTRILVATDVAARGIDIEGLSHVINYALPFDTQTYVHRIGRTGRAGAKGQAVTFVRPEERRKLEFLKQALKKFTKDTMGVMETGTVPSVKEVLAAKRSRLIARLLSTMDSEENAKTGGESSIFSGIAEELCAEHDGAVVVGKLLELAYGDDFDPARYGEVSVTQERTDKRSAVSKSRSFGNAETMSVGTRTEQIRLYVGFGKRDGFGAREIASYFSTLLEIPPHLVDRIEVTENFSLISLPHQSGLAALERSNRDKRLPHMHIDVKDTAARGNIPFHRRPPSQRTFPQNRKGGGHNRRH